MSTPDEQTQSPPRAGTAAPAWWRRPRWRYGAAAFLLGVAETSAAMALGFRATVGEADVTWIAILVLEVSYTGFGFLIGVVVEARRRERAAAENEAAQLEALARAETRLAQTEKLAALGELASTIAHEVRNPLAILRSSVQNLAESLDTPDDVPRDEARQTCDDLIEEIDRLAHVTATLVDFARPVVPRRRSVSVDALVTQAHALAERLVADRPLTLIHASDPSSPPIVLDADSDLLCQVLLGLVDNAAHVSPDGATIALGWHRGKTSEEAGARAVLTVTDQGPGVPDDDQARIFEPFVTTRVGGHGLGLAVARQIVEAHGGTLGVESPVDARGGARFVVELPVSSYDAEGAA